VVSAQYIQIGKGIVTGNPITPFCTELQGMVAVYCSVYHVMQYYDIHTTNKLTLYTDNMKVLHYQHAIHDHHTLGMAYIDDYDLYLHMEHYHNEMKRRGLNISKAIHTNNDSPQHKDPTKHFHQEMDTLARQHRIQTIPQQHIPTKTDRVHITDNDGDITSRERQILETNWTTYRIEQYFIQRWDLTAPRIQQYEWTTYERIYQKSSPAQRKFMCKMMTGWLPVYHHLNKMTTEKQYCPLCQTTKLSLTFFSANIEGHGDKISQTSYDNNWKTKGFHMT